MQAEIQRQTPMDSKIILNKGAVVPAVVVFCDRGILSHRSRQSEQEICERVSRLAPIKGENSVVVQQRIVNVFLQRHLATGFQRVAAFVPIKKFPKPIIVAAGNRARNCLTESKEARNLDLRKSRRALNLKFRSKVRE